MEHRWREPRDTGHIAKGGAGSGLSLDLPERKGVEDALRENETEFQDDADADETALMRAQRAERSLRLVRAELAHVSRVTTLGQLTASIIHEITQPIATARNNARAALNFLDRRQPNLGEIRDALASIVGDIDRAGNIIDRIRDQIKKTPPHEERFDLNEAIEEVIALARGAITKNGVAVQTPDMKKALRVEGDRIQLQQVVLNLILNAAEAMGTLRQGPRDLSIGIAQTQARDVVVTVCDTGPGIDPNDRERIFQPFYTTKSSGVGMGLAICRCIVEAHGGRLWADANKPRGAMFRFTLPKHGTVTNCHELRAPHKDIASRPPRRQACSGSKAPRRAARGPGRHHWDRP